VILAAGPLQLYKVTQESDLSVKTDEKGSFRVERVKPGPYRIWAEKEGYRSLAFTTITLGPGQITRQEISLEPMVRVSGWVIDESDRPVEGAKVRVIKRPSPQDAQPSSEKQLGIDQSTKTGRKGEFELFVGPEDQKITLLALVSGYAPARLGPLSVRAGQTQKGYLLRLPRGLEASGRVVDKEGVPIAGVTILARRSWSRQAGIGVREFETQATSGLDGKFILRGLEEGSYRLTLTRNTYATRAVPEIEIRSTRANNLAAIVLQPDVAIKGRIENTVGKVVSGARIIGVVQGLSSNETISDRGGLFILRGFADQSTVTLSVTATGYRPADTVVRAPNKDVVLVLSQHGMLRGRVQDSETGAPLREFRIRIGFGDMVSFHSEDGTFEWKDLPSGRETFIAQAPGYQAAELTNIEIRVGETTEGVVFSLVKGVDLKGQVVDAQSGVKLPNVRVSYRVSNEQDYPPWALDWNAQITDSDGAFKFDGLPAGKVAVLARSHGYAETLRTVMAGEEGAVVEIRLPKASSISGRVVGSDGTNLSASQVRLWSYSSRTGITSPTDENGTFLFGDLSKGRYRLTAQTELRQGTPQEIELLESESRKDLVLTISPGGTIQGSVVGLAPTERRVLHVVAEGPAGFRSSVTTHPDGTYVIQGVPIGWIKVTVQTSSQRIISKSIELRAEVDEVTLNIEFPLVARLSGRVMRGDQPVADRTVSAVPNAQDSGAGFAQTDANGMYVIDGLSEGDYLVALSGGVTKKLRISGNTVLDMELSALSVSGRVLESKTGKPLAGVAVQVSRGGSAIDTTISATDSQGRFSVEDLEPGSYQLSAHRPGFRIGTQTFSIPSSSDLLVDLTPAQGILIKAIDGITGLALQALTIDVSSEAQSIRLNIQLDESGSGELPEFPSGRYNLFISSRGYASQALSGWTTLSPLSLTFTPGGRLEIEVDSAYSGAKASLMDARGIPAALLHNEFSLMQPTILPNIAPGEYMLLVESSERKQRYKVTVFEGQTTALRVK
jgi:protocatechuate 3,4-dioxygenase beta subunit